MEQRVDDLAAALQSIQEQNASIMQAVAASTALFEEIRPAVVDLAEWRSGLEQSVADLRLELGGMRKELDLLGRNPVLTIRPTDLPPLLRRPTAPSPLTAGHNNTSGPDGHRAESSHRGAGNGVVTALVSPPVTGGSSGDFQTPGTSSL